MNANRRRAVFRSCALTNDINSSPTVVYYILFSIFFCSHNSGPDCKYEKKTVLFSYILAGRQLHCSVIDVIIHYTLIPVYCYVYFVVYKYTIHLHITYV